MPAPESRRRRDGGRIYRPQNFASAARRRHTISQNFVGTKYHGRKAVGLYLKGLRETPAIDPFPGFGERKIYKARVVPLKENIGKSKGYRVIFQMADEENCKILVFSRHGIYKSEQELINLVKERMG